MSLALPTIERILYRHRLNRSYTLQADEDDERVSSSYIHSSTPVFEDVNPAKDNVSPKPTFPQSLEVSSEANPKQEDATAKKLKEEKSLRLKAEEEVTILNARIQVLMRVIQQSDEVNKMRIDAHEAHARTLVRLNKSLEITFAITQRRLNDAYGIIGSMESATGPRPSVCRSLQRSG